MKRIKVDTLPREHKHKDSWGEKKLWYTYLSETPLTPALGWPATTRMDPTSTINLGGGVVGVPLNLCSPPVGSHVDQRVGRAIRIYKVTVYGVVEKTTDSTAEGDPGHVVRVVLLLDQHTNGAQFTATDVFISTGADFTALGSFLNPSGFGRFKILRDKMFVMNEQTAAYKSTDLLTCTGVKKIVKLKYKWPQGLPVRFNSNATGTVMSVITNSLHVMAAVSEVVTSVPMTFMYNACVEYYNVEPGSETVTIN